MELQRLEPRCVMSIGLRIMRGEHRVGDVCNIRKEEKKELTAKSLRNVVFIHILLLLLLMWIFGGKRTTDGFRHANKRDFLSFLFLCMRSEKK